MRRHGFAIGSDFDPVATLLPSAPPIINPLAGPDTVLGSDWADWISTLMRRHGFAIGSDFEPVAMFLPSAVSGALAAIAIPKASSIASSATSISNRSACCSIWPSGLHVQACRCFCLSVRDAVSDTKSSRMRSGWLTRTITLSAVLSVLQAFSGNNNVAVVVPVTQPIYTLKPPLHPTVMSTKPESPVIPTANARTVDSAPLPDVDHTSGELGADILSKNKQDLTTAFSGIRGTPQAQMHLRYSARIIDNYRSLTITTGTWSALREQTFANARTVGSAPLPDVDHTFGALGMGGTPRAPMHLRHVLQRWANKLLRIKSVWRRLILCSILLFTTTTPFFAMVKNELDNISSAACIGNITQLIIYLSGVVSLGLFLFLRDVSPPKTGVRFAAQRYRALLRKWRPFEKKHDPKDAEEVAETGRQLKAMSLMALVIEA
ncbi:hypothetical protein B0H11DRAFT_1912167 [Mycena galericulata]|nr:hypothetical protein B0H11DRAFT_1912167 [Mycena galericulata]